MAYILLLMKRKTFKHTLSYRMTFKLHGNNIKDNCIISERVNSITTIKLA